jgi:hypothetical protein
MPVEDREVRDRRKCTKVGLLPSRAVRIVRASTEPRREVSNSMNAMSARDKAPTELADIEPLEWRVLDAAVLQVEPIDVDVGE